MTVIAELYLVIKKPHSREAWTRFWAMFQRQQPSDQHRFVVLAWKRTGSNLLCGILFHHPEITMHNELFNPIDIFSYYQQALLRNDHGDRWNTLGRDQYPEAFLQHIWTGKLINGQKVKERSKAIGFKSFPDHWTDANNLSIWEKEVMEDHRVKKVILVREDELAVIWSNKTYRVLPNWIETIAILLAHSVVVQHDKKEFLATSVAIAGIEHVLLTLKYYRQAARHVKGWFGKKVWVALGAGTILSAQEVTRVVAHIRRGHWHCLCRRMDWNDGQNPRVKLDTQLNSIMRFALYGAIVCGIRALKKERKL